MSFIENSPTVFRAFRKRVKSQRVFFQFELIFSLLFWGFLLTVDGSIPVAFDVKEFVTSQECVEQRHENYKSMQKSQTIKVNGKNIDYSKIRLNDSSSSSAVITLSISRSRVQLSVLNISYTNLLLLDVSYCGLESVSDIGNETFPSLRLFNLSHNSLSSVKSHLFHHLKELEILDLSHNCFASFHYNEIFLRHEHLKRLFLNDNRLYRIQSTFREPKLMTLDFLDFSNNFISEFSNYAFQIKRLNMQNNSLTSVSIFHATEMTLNAQHNDLVHFYAPRGTFLVLNLAHNKFQFISYVEIDDATVLDLSNNDISMWSPEEDSSEELISTENLLIDEDIPIDSAMLMETLPESNFVRTKFINLANNKITAIEHLKKFRNSLELNLEGNKLVNVSPANIRNMFPLLRRVIIAGNPLNKIDVENIKKFNAEHSTQFQLNFQLHATIRTTTKSPFLITLPPLIIPTLPSNLFQPVITTQKSSILTTTTSSPLTTPTPQMESATAAQKTTEKPTTESDETASTIALIEPDESPFPIWLFGIIFITLVVFSLGYCYYRENQTARNNYRNFNEVENFL